MTNEWHKLHHSSAMADRRRWPLHVSAVLAGGTALALLLALDEPGLAAEATGAGGGAAAGTYFGGGKGGNAGENGENGLGPRGAAGGTAVRPDGTGASVIGGVSHGGGGGAGGASGKTDTANGNITGALIGGKGGNGGPGGGGGGAGGDGVRISGTGTITIDATISGGAGGRGGSGTNSPASVNHILRGGGGGGGAGIVLLDDSTVTVTSKVTGGAGGDDNGGGGGGAGIILDQNGVLTIGNGASVTAGAGGYGGDGGVGILLQSQGAVTVAGGGKITGGGAFDGTYENAGAGGAAISAAVRSYIINSGELQGGVGGNAAGDETPAYSGGIGGFGSGGAAGHVTDSSRKGVGGIGILGAAGGYVSIVNSGKIRGDLGHGGRANAISLFGSGNRLELQAGSDITGNVVVVAGGGTDNVLALGGGVNSSFNVSKIATTQQYRGFDTLEKTGASIWTLTGTSTFSGTTVIEAGTLRAGNADAFAEGAYVVNGGTLDLGGFDLAVSSLSGIGGTVAFGSANMTVDQVANTIYTGAIIGTGDFVKLGAGMLTLTGNSSFGAATVDEGTLTISAGGTVVVEDGSGGAGTALLGHSGTRGGTLNIGAAAAATAVAAGTLDAAAINFSDAAGTLNFNHSGATTFAAGLESTGTGVHSLNHLAGDTKLTGNSATFTGATTVTGGTLAVATALGGSALVTGGTLIVDGRFGGPVEALTNGIVSGAGTVAGNAEFSGGGKLAGAQGQTLRVDRDLVLDTGSMVNVALGGASATALFHVGGDLMLDSWLNVTDAGGFGFGVYRIFDYDNALSGPGLGIGDTPAGVSRADLAVQTVVPGQVNLISTTGAVLSFWDGGNTTLHDNDAIDGGSGAWRAGGRNWTVADGSVNGPFQPNPTYAVFQAAGGLVSVDASAGALGVTGMQFAADGYRIEGDAIALEGAGGQSIIRVGDSTNAGAGMTATIISALTGHSTLVKSDHGRLVLAGANTFDGGVRLDAGVLSVSSDANLGAATGGLIFNGGTLATTGGFDSGRAVTLLNAAARLDVGTGTTLGLTGAVSGLGDLMKFGGGTLVLTGANAYRSTLVEAGTIVGNAASISGDIFNAATVVFDQGSAASFAGAIGGLGGIDGEMVKRGAGTLTLTGASALDWTVEAGGLMASAALFGGDADLGAGTSLTFDQASAASYGGVLSGPGALALSGSGAVTLTGNSVTFAGTTTVSADSELIVGTWLGGALGGALTIGSGGLLGGTGTIGSAGSTVTIAAGAVHAPGNSIGVQHVLGDYANHGTLRIEATPSEADRIVVAGPADITGATLDLMLSPSDAASWNAFNGPYTIIDKQSAGAVVGTFIDPITQSLLFLDALVAYDGGDGNDVTLELARNDLAFAGVGQTSNQIATGAAVDTLDHTHAVWRSIALNNDENIVRASVDALSGEIHASAQTVVIEDSRFVRNAINDRIRAAFGDAGASLAPVLANGPDDASILVAPDHDGLAFWANGFGSWGSTNSDGNAAGLDRNTGGLLLGADTLAGDWRIGLLASYGRSAIETQARFSSASSDNYHFGLYGGTQWGNLAVRIGVAYTWHHLDTGRTVAIPSIAENLTADYRAGTFQGFGELGYGIEIGNVRFEPFANVAHVSLNTDGFAEAGGNAALTGTEGSTDVTFTTLGLRMEHGFTLGSTDAALKGMVGWWHAFEDTTPTRVYAFSAGDAFSIAGAPIARDSAVIEVGLDLHLAPAATFGLSYTGQLAAGAQDHGFKANLNIRF